MEKEQVELNNSATATSNAADTNNQNGDSGSKKRGRPRKEAR